MVLRDIQISLYIKKNFVESIHNQEALLKKYESLDREYFQIIQHQCPQININLPN